MTVLRRVASGKHNLLAGFEYAPAFFEPEDGFKITVHNLGFTVGYQFRVR